MRRKEICRVPPEILCARLLAEDKISESLVSVFFALPTLRTILKVIISTDPWF